jgi:hypothetical protein
MTEAEWLACTDPQEMLGFLAGAVVTLVDDHAEVDERERTRLHVRGMLAGRKSRLLACACSRIVWSLLTDRSRGAVERVEDQLDHPSGADRPGASGDDAHDAPSHQPCRTGDFAEPATLAARHAARVARWAVSSDGRWARVSEIVEDSAMAASWAGLFPSLCEASREQCGLVRDIFGNPFRPATLDPTWLMPAVTSLAHAIYADHAFTRMPELADALAAAGCTDADVLSNCRGPGPHVRGCWVVDLILGK